MVEKKEKRVVKRKENEEQFINQLKQALQKAEQVPVSQSAKELGQALQIWSQEFGVNCQDEVASIEIQAFAPDATSQKLSTEVINAIKEKLQQTVLLILPFMLLIGSGMIQESYAEEVTLTDVAGI